MQKETKRICYTLDLEADYEGMVKEDFCGVIRNRQNIELFCELIRKHKIKLTAFVTGEILHRKERVIARLQDLGTEFGIHTFSHQMNFGFDLTDKKKLQEEVQKGKEAFINYFGRVPQAYRAATGVVSKEYLKIIAQAGFQIDSSIFPSFRPGYFNNLNENTEPHLLQGTNLLEIPFSVVPKIRLVISQSYIKLFGLPLYKLALNLFGFPRLIVFDFHLADLFPNPTRKKLTIPLRLAHRRNLKHGLKCFERVIEYFQKQNYENKYLSEIYENYYHHPR